MTQKAFTISSFYDSIKIPGFNAKQRKFFQSVSIYFRYFDYPAQQKQNKKKNSIVR